MKKVLNILTAILLLTSSAYAGRVILVVQKMDDTQDATLTYTVERDMAGRLTQLGGVQVDLKNVNSRFEVTFNFKDPDDSWLSFFTKRYDRCLSIETCSGAVKENYVFKEMRYAFWVHEFKDGMEKDFTIYQDELSVDHLMDKVAAKFAADLL
jgi:hypothetical protein